MVATDSGTYIHPCQSQLTHWEWYSYPYQSSTVHGHISNGTFIVTSYIIIADISNLNTANITIDIASAYITAGIDFHSGNIIVPYLSE